VDVGSGKELKQFRGHSGAVQACEFAPNGKTIVSGSEDKALKIWDVASGTCRATLKGHSREVMAVALSIHGLLASAGVNGTVKIWNTSAGECLKTLEGHSNWVLVCEFAPNGKTTVSGFVDKTLKIRRR
jgi:WD40 repeat protein